MEYAAKWDQKYVLSWPVYKLYFRLVWWGKCFCSSCKYKAMLSHARVFFLFYLWFCWQYCDFVCVFYALLLLCCARFLFMRSYCFVVLVLFLCALIALLCSFSFYALLLLCCARLLFMRSYCFVVLVCLLVLLFNWSVLLSVYMCFISLKAHRPLF